MTRRGRFDPPVRARIVALTLAAAALLVAGCLGGPAPEPPEPTVSIANASGAPGETVRVEVTAHRVARMNIGSRADDPRSVLYGAVDGGEPFPTGVPAENPHIVFDGIAFSDGPDRVAESFPPQWGWDPPADEVRVTVPVRIQTETPPGRYRFAVSMGGPAGSANATAWVEVR